MKIAVKHAGSGTVAVIDDTEASLYGEPDWVVISEDVEGLLGAVARGTPLHENDGVLVHDVDVTRANKWAEIKRERDLRRVVVGTQDFGVFDANEEARTNFLGKLLGFWVREKLGMSLPETVMWKRHDNQFINPTMVEFFQAALQVLDGIEAVYLQSFVLEQEVNDPTKTTVEEVEAITWPGDPPLNDTSITS